MKNFIYSILAVLLCIIVIGGVAVFAYDKASDNPVNILPSDSAVEGDEFNDNDTSGGGTSDKENTSGDGATGDSSSNGDNTDVEIITQPLTDPASKADYIATGLEMIQGASINLTSERPAIRFMCKISAELKAEVDADENKQIAMLLAPLDYYDAVNTNNYTYMDWVSAFETAGKTYLFGTYEGYNAYGNDYMIRFILQDVLYQNINRKFVAIGCVVTTNGSAVSYKYAAFPSGLDYRTNARSCAYVATAALNAHAAGLDSYEETAVTALKAYVNESVDRANGLEEVTNDGSMYSLNYYPNSSKTVAVGEIFKIETSITPNVAVPILFQSSNTDIITVDTSGNVTAIASGTAVVKMYLAGQEYSLSVIVT